MPGWRRSCATSGAPADRGERRWDGPPRPRDHGRVAAHSLDMQVRRIGLAAGLDAIGVAPAAPFASTRQVLEDRRAAGLNGTMQFTYRNPARSTDPDRTLPGVRALVVGARSYRRERPTPPDRSGPDGERRPVHVGRRP